MDYTMLKRRDCLTSFFVSSLFLLVLIFIKLSLAFGDYCGQAFVEPLVLFRARF